MQVKQGLQFEQEAQGKDGRYHPWADKFAHAFKTLTILSFCEKIVPLLSSVNFDNGNRVIMHLLPEEMPLHLEMLRAIGDALVYVKEQGAITVFEDLTLEHQSEGLWEFDAGDNFREHGAEGQERTHQLRALPELSSVFYSQICASFSGISISSWQQYKSVFAAYCEPITWMQAPRQFGLRHYTQQFE